MTNQEAIALDFYRTGGDHSWHPNWIPCGNIKYVDWKAIQDAYAERVMKLEAKRKQKEEL